MKSNEQTKIDNDVKNETINLKINIETKTDDCIKKKYIDLKSNQMIKTDDSAQNNNFRSFDLGKNNGKIESIITIKPGNNLENDVCASSLSNGRIEKRIK